MIEVWGMSGKLSVGKDHIAQKVLLPMLPEKRTIMVAFANHFKIDAIVKAGLDRDKVFGRKDEHTRQTLQRLGTEEGRNKYGDDIWIKLCHEWIKYYESIGYERVVVMDVRFPNEVSFVHEIGGQVVRVEAPERNRAAIARESHDNPEAIKQIMSHSSETSLDECKDFDLIVKNDEFDNPFIQVRNFIREHTEQNKPEIVFLVDVDDTIGECHIYYEDTIDKVQELVNDYTLKYGVDNEIAVKLFRNYVAQMRTRVNTSVFIHTRFANDLAWAITNTINQTQDDKLITDNYARKAIDIGMAVYDYPYRPLPGAIDALRKLATKGKVVLFTLGDRLEQAKKIAGLGISDFPFEVTHDKCKTTFEGLLRKYPAKTHIMIGDNMSRDIQPALAAGVDYCYWINPEYISAICGEVADDNFEEVTSLEEAVGQISAYIELTNLKTKYYVTGELQEADKPNKNGRIYPKEVLASQLALLSSVPNHQWNETIQTD